MEPLAREALTEWKRILAYWEKYAPDYERGGFHGRVNYDNKPVVDAARSVILTSRILWTFSSAYRYFHRRKYLVLADRAYHYLYNHFRDVQNGGVYWSVTATGAPLDTRKQLYAQAFAIYGISEYYAASKFQPALDFAKELFQVVDKHGYDEEFGGYFESFGTKWEAVDDLILSKMPWNKSQNTHLHLIEAFTNLYRVWPDVVLKQRVGHLLDMFLEKLIDSDTHRLRLFFDQRWSPQAQTISYGHNIEASWLLWETAEVLHDPSRTELVKQKCIKVATAACTGLGADGALHYEFDPATNHLNQERSWWVLAEQMVGFYNAYQLTKETHYKEKAEKSWTFIKKYFIDSQRGEWYGSVTPELTSIKGDKINFWKCPYHNSRACYEMVRRLSEK
ncbi:mannobiose 2-epimerase [Runella defluvii]|uniref:Cellobiose 2-epimerase n=1 Tax=Runella defluvii TaxID=370973 RepID=A0A7W5ZLC7_9BACT|nr:AGE family epimerase/isomerase [Runella defluvii]MBB3837919.1 mannobiose 2-epimerase [Runella defluvii]